MPKRNLAWILVVVMIALLMWQLPQTIARRDSVSQAFGPLVDVRAQIHKRYVEDVEDEALVSSAVRGGIEAMLEGLGDRYARYYDQEQFERLQDRTAGRFGGLGIEVWATARGLRVHGVVRGSPAARAGIAPGDVITRVDAFPTAGLPLVEAVHDLLNGPPGTEAALTLVRPDGQGGEAMREVRVRRAVIRIDPIRGWCRTPTGGWRFLFDETAGIGYVHLTKFMPNVDRRLDSVVNRLLRENLHGLILDMRNNPGGLRDSASDVADRFLDQGLIVSTGGRRADGKQWYATRDGTYPPFHLVVLINGSTASAAEIVAGALHDHRRAVVVGERSYGKGSVQEVIPLAPGNGAIKITTAFYFLPNGECVQRTPAAIKSGSWGVAPDVPVPMTEQQQQAALVVWRELGGGRPAGGSTQPAQGGGGASADPGYYDRAARRLLAVDAQLKAAADTLRGQIVPPVAGGGRNLRGGV